MFKSKILKIHAIILMIGLLFAGLYFIPNANAATIIKWVDAQGVTHYGDKLPAQEAGRVNTEIDSQGITVKKSTLATPASAQQNQEKAEQDRKDKILLASYTNENEIDLARDRNLEMDQASLTALSTQKENAASNITRNQKAADGFSQRKKPIPAYVSEALKSSKSESSKIDKQIAGRKMSMEAIRKRFSDEKARFIALKQADTPDASAVSPAATPAKPK